MLPPVLAHFPLVLTPPSLPRLHSFAQVAETVPGGMRPPRAVAVVLPAAVEGLQLRQATMVSVWWCAVMHTRVCHRRAELVIP